MSERARAYVAAAGLWLLVVGGAMSTRPFKKGLFSLDGLESMAFLLLLLALASSARLRALLAGIGRPRALLVAAVLGLVLWGQLARDNRVSFPFLHWSMYTHKRPPNHYLEYVATYRSGEAGLFPFGQLTLFSGSQVLDPQGRMLESRITTWLTPEEGEIASDAARAELEKLVVTYNAAHAADPVVRLSVMRRRVPIQGFTGRESIRSEALLEMRFDG
jgi:hypothetical protein